MADEADRWLHEAREELAIARVLPERDDLPARGACLHAHLAGEKAIKALLIHSDVVLRRSHDLFELVGLLPDADATVIDEDDLEVLNPWAIEGRYPADLDDIATERAAGVVEARHPGGGPGPTPPVELPELPMPCRSVQVHPVLTPVRHRYLCHPTFRFSRPIPLGSSS